MPDVILISDREAREKPCIRCGYSLRHIAGAKNCPECGLAVRISLSENKGLDWANPKWQRAMAAGAMLLALYELLIPTQWAINLLLIYKDEIEIAALWTSILYSISSIVEFVSLAVFPMALLFFARREGRYPYTARVTRHILYALAIGYVLLRILQYLVINDWFGQIIPSWFWPYVYRPLRSPLPIVIRDFFLLVGLGSLAKRAGVRWFEEAFAWVVVFGILRCMLGIVRFFPYQFWVEEIAWLVIYPLAVATLCIYVSMVMLRGAREAHSNWVSDE